MLLVRELGKGMTSWRSFANPISAERRNRIWPEIMIAEMISTTEMANCRTTSAFRSDTAASELEKLIQDLYGPEEER